MQFPISRWHRLLVFSVLTPVFTLAGFWMGDDYCSFTAARFSSFETSADNPNVQLTYTYRSHGWPRPIVEVYRHDWQNLGTGSISDPISAARKKSLWGKSSDKDQHDTCPCSDRRAQTSADGPRRRINWNGLAFDLATSAAMSLCFVAVLAVAGKMVTDRLRARRRFQGLCVECRYDLSGSRHSGICPECGTPWQRLPESQS